MADEINTSIGFTLNEAERNKALSALEALRKQQIETAQAVLKGSKNYQVATDEVAKFEKQQQKLVKTLKDNGLENQSKDLLKWTDSAEKATYETIALDARLQDLDASFGRISNQIGQAGDIASGIGQAGGAFSSIPGLGGAGQAIGQGASVGTAIFDVIEAAPRLTVALKGVPDILQKAAQASGGLTASVATGLTPALGATGAAATAVLAPIALVVAAAGALTLAFKQYNDAAEAQRKVLEANINAISETNQAIAGGLTSEDATAQIEQLQAAREAEAQTLATLQGGYADMESQLGETFGILGGAVTAGIKAFDSREQELADSIKESESALTGYDVQIRLLEQALEDGALSANDTKVAEEELTAVREDSIKQLLSEQTQAIQQISQLESQANALRTNYSEQNLDRLEDEQLAETQAAETAALEAQFANEDRLANQQAFQDSLVAIEKDGQAKIASLRQDLASLATERIQALGESEAKGNADIEKARKDYMKDSLKTLEKFQESEKRTQQRGQIDRLRLLQDLNDSLSDAQRDNNVIAFLEAQRNGEKEISRQAQDASIEAQQRAADFARENEERRAALDQRIADIQANIDKEREQINAQYAEKEAALKQSIIDEQVAIQQRTQAAIQAQNTQAQNEAKNAERAALREQLQSQQEEQRAALVEARRVREHQEQLNRIDQQAQAQQRALAAVMSQISALQAKAQQQASQANSLSGKSGSSNAGTFSFSTANYGGNKVKAFAKGGIVRGGQPQLAIVGDTPSDTDEFIKPFKRSEGLPVMADSKSSSKASVVLNFNPTFATNVGEITSPSEVTEALREFAIAYGQAEISKLEKYLQGTG